MVINGTLYPVIEPKIIPGEDSILTNLDFNWTCTNFTSGSMDLQLNFTNASQISMFTHRDTVEVKFFGNEIFRAEDNQAFPPEVAP